MTRTEAQDPFGLGPGREGPSRYAVAVTALTLVSVGVLAALQVPDGAPAVPLWVAGLAATPFLLLRVERLGRVWMRVGSSYAALWVALLVAATGGHRSPYLLLYAVLLTLAAITHSRRRLAVLGALAFAGSLSPVLYDPGADGAFVQEIVVQALFLLAAAFAVQELVRRLTTTQEQFRSLAQNASDVIYRYRMRPTPGFEFINDVIADVTGYPVERFLDDPSFIWQRVHPDDRERHHGLRRDAARIQEPIVVRWQRPDGSWAWLEERLTPLYDADGRIEAVHGIVRDVSRQQQAEERLRRALEHERTAADRLRAVDDLKTAFLQAVSHELRTPLTSLVGYTETLRFHRRRLSDAQVEDVLDRLVANAAKLDRMLTDLLDVDRLSQGHVQANREPTDLRGLVEHAVRALEITDRPVVLELADVTADVDAAKVERIVDNLLGNALRHTPPGTTITVRLEGLDDGAHLVVEDAGPGIPDGLAHEIFAPFRQGPEASSDASPGTGIGLALVARLATLHGGRAWVDERTGGGARFHVVLPDTGSTDAEPVRIDVDRAVV